jgi:hypothetical protein
MTKTYTEKRRCIDGSFNSYEITETDQWNGKQLGTELPTIPVLFIAECDHYENDDAEGIEIESGKWVKKSLVKKVIWQKDSSGIRTLARVEYARPVLNRN